MSAFRTYLVIVIACLGTYTMIVGLNHGWNILPVFFGDLAAMTWPGQFNSDFMSFLSLSGLWLAWRHQFSPAGLALGVVGIFGGMMVLAPYLVFASLKANVKVGSVAYALEHSSVFDRAVSRGRLLHTRA
jgi:hypothetical protein